MHQKTTFVHQCPPFKTAPSKALGPTVPTAAEALVAFTLHTHTHTRVDPQTNKQPHSFTYELLVFYLHFKIHR